jgi:hypothetical protein
MPSKEFTLDEVAQVSTTKHTLPRCKLNTLTAQQGGRPRACSNFVYQTAADPFEQWVVIDSKVFNLSRFADLHPGGASVLYAGGVGKCTDF